MTTRNPNDTTQHFNGYEDMIREMNNQDNAGGMDEEAFDEVQYAAVSNMYIKDVTREGYQGSNKRLLLWLNKKQPTCISADAKRDLQNTFEAQVVMGASAKEKNVAVEKKALAIIKGASAGCQPIIFENLTVEIFVKFLFAMARQNTTDGNKFLSKSGCGSYRSSLKELYRVCKVQMLPEFEAELSTKFKGLLRGHAVEKEQKGGRLGEGKDPMSFALYKLLCDKMIQDGSKTAVFAHTFLTLTWNLIARSKNTVHIHRNHIGWENDCLTVQFAHMKTDVEGGDSARKRHIYANPHCISICAPTALAKYLVAFPAKDNGMLFDDKSYARFSKFLKELIGNHKDEVEMLGVSIDDIGVHSIRKGAATYCCMGTTAAPHIAAVCNRAGWTMGKVKDTYIQYAEAGDQHVGRVVAGLPVLNVKYACSPAYFCIDNNGTATENTCTAREIDAFIALIFPFEFRIQFKPVLIHCAASLLFARDFFDEKFPTQR